MLACASARGSSAAVRLQVLTRLNVRDCRSFVHDISAMRLLFSNPVTDRCKIELRIDNALHAKLYIFDDATTIVTSSNLTYAGFYKNLEVATLETKDVPIVAASVAHFNAVFAAASPVTPQLLADVASALREGPTSLPDLAGSDTPAAPVVDQEELLAAVPMDREVVGAIDDCLTQQLLDDLTESTIAVGAGEPNGSGCAQSTRTRFYEDMHAAALVAVFGVRTPALVDLSAIFAHPSAYPYLRVCVPDANRAEGLETVGKVALYAILAHIVASRGFPRQARARPYLDERSITSRVRTTLLAG